MLIKKKGKIINILKINYFDLLIIQRLGHELPNQLLKLIDYIYNT